MIGERLKHAFIGNTAWVLSYREECFDQIGLKATEKVSLFNGALDCEFRKYEIFDGKYKEFKKKESENEAENQSENEDENKETAFKSREDKEFKPRENREFKPRESRRPGDSKPWNNRSRDRKPYEFHKDEDRERKPFDRERRQGGNGEFRPRREFKPRNREDRE